MSKRTFRGMVAGRRAQGVAGLIALQGLVGALAAQTIELSDVAAGLVPGFAITGGPAHEMSGSSVASAGDVNGDGLPDYVIGAPQASANGNADAGMTYVVFGSTAWQPLDLSAIAAGVSPQGFAIRGAAAGDESGASVAGVGDMNGDGLSEVIVGAALSDVGANTSAGRAYVVWGKTSTTPVELSSIAQWQIGYGFAIQGDEANDQTGMSVSAAGDVNGDGRADVIVGAPGSDTAAGLNAGRAFVVFGKTAHWPVHVSSLAAGLVSSGFAIEGEAATDFAGTAVASAGDVNGDGLADVLVSAPGYEFGPFPLVGRAYVVFGRTSSAVVSLAQVGSGVGGHGFAIQGEGEHDQIATSVSSAGDVNGDGLADVLVSTHMPSIPENIFEPTIQGPGRAYVVFGKTSDDGVLLASLAAGFPGLGFAIDGEVDNDWAGYSVSAAGDVNGDGLADVLVGAPFHDFAGGVSAGRAYLVLGKHSEDMVHLTTLAAGAPALGLTLDGESGGAGYGFTAGRSVAAAGDANRDGLPDLMVSAPGYETGLANGGRTYIVSSPFVASDSYPLGPPRTGTYKAWFAPGMIDIQGVGTHRHGDDETVAADSRCWIDFVAGSGPANQLSGGPSWATVTLARTNASVANLPLGMGTLANVRWTITTNRVNYINARVTFRYTDAELLGADENTLTILESTAPSGPWLVLGKLERNAVRNEVSAVTTNLGLVARHYVLVEGP